MRDFGGFQFGFGTPSIIMEVGMGMNERIMEIITIVGRLIGCCMLSLAFGLFALSQVGETIERQDAPSARAQATAAPPLALIAESATRKSLLVLNSTNCRLAITSEHLRFTLALALPLDVDRQLASANCVSEPNMLSLF